MNLPITLVALAALAAILPVESQGADSAFAENHSVSFISMNSGLSHNLSLIHISEPTRPST